MRQSKQTPGEWSHVILCDQPRGRFALRLSICYTRIGSLGFKAMRLPEDTKDDGLTLKQALELGANVDAWIESQNERRKRR